MPAKQYQKKIKELEDECSKISLRMLESEKDDDDEDNEKLKKLAESILSLDPENANGNNFLGEYCHNIGEYEQAISYHDLAISLDKTCAWAYFDKACSLQYMNEFQEFVHPINEIQEWARTGILLDPNLLKDGGSWVNDFFTEEELSEIKKEIKQNQKTKKSKELIALEGQIFAVSWQEEKDYIALEEACHDVLSIDKNNAHAIYFLGIVAYEDIQDYKKAAYYFNKAMKLDKDNGMKISLAKSLYYQTTEQDKVKNYKKSFHFLRAKTLIKNAIIADPEYLDPEYLGGNIIFEENCPCDSCNGGVHNWLNTFFTQEEQQAINKEIEYNKQNLICASPSSFAVPAMLGAAAIIGSVLASSSKSNERDASSN
jgi:tetratricopeptide (TPR) repeat protein